MWECLSEARCSRLKSGVGLGRRILSLRVYDRESFTSFHVQAVMPVTLVKPIDTRIREHLASDKHSHIFKHLRARLLPNRSPVAWGSQRIALGALIFHSNTFHFICWAPKFSAFSSEGPFTIFLGSSLGEALKIVAPGVQKTVLKSSTLLPHVSN